MAEEKAIDENESIDQIFKQLENSSSTKKQELTLQKLINSDKLFEKYLKRSAECKEIFQFLDETSEALGELKKSSLSLNINETNADTLFAFIEKAINFYKSKTSSLDDKKLELIDKGGLKENLNGIITNLLNKYLDLLTKCILMKSGTKKTIELQETCVRLLTLCIQQHISFAKQIALFYDYFNNHKNWLERFLLMKQTYLRELSIELLLSYLKYAKVTTSGDQSANDLGEQNPKVSGSSSENKDTLFLIKKIFFNTETGSSKRNEESSSKSAKPNQLSLIYCLFAHVGSDSRESIELLLQELLFRFVQNESFNTSEKIKLFNEKSLSSLIKLFEWSDTSKENQEEPVVEDQTLIVREMITEFLKILFCSTKHGINFYDRSLNIDQSPKNYNHLIFNALISIQRPVLEKNSKKSAHKLEIIAKTNDMIDDLMLKTLKDCPDLIQRFLKVKQKQESNKEAGVVNRVT